MLWLRFMLWFHFRFRLWFHFHFRLRFRHRLRHRFRLHLPLHLRRHLDRRVVVFTHIERLTDLHLRVLARRPRPLVFVSPRARIRIRVLLVEILRSVPPRRLLHAVVIIRHLPGLVVIHSPSRARALLSRVVPRERRVVIGTIHHRSRRVQIHRARRANARARDPERDRDDGGATRARASTASSASRHGRRRRSVRMTASSWKRSLASRHRDSRFRGRHASDARRPTRATRR